MRGATQSHFHRFTRSVFQFTHPVRGATMANLIENREETRFNSRTPCGVRLVLRRRCLVALLFQFTHPVRGATSRHNQLTIRISVSIHAPRAGCDFVLTKLMSVMVVSIHAPRAGCDGSFFYGFIQRWSFNSRTPCGVRRHSYTLPRIYLRFQFTHPVRGATLITESRKMRVKGFNSRTPCGVRQSYY